MSHNIRVIPRENPLILEIKIEPDTIINGFQAVSAQSLTMVRTIINKNLLTRHYKKLILNLDKVEFGASALLAKILMCYEKAMGVKCEVYNFNATPRLAIQYKMSRMDELMPILSVEQTPKPEEYDTFFGFHYPLEKESQEKNEELEDHTSPITYNYTNSSM